jgi:hypothetical protein
MSRSCHPRLLLALRSGRKSYVQLLFRKEGQPRRDLCVSFVSVVGILWTYSGEASLHEFRAYPKRHSNRKVGRWQKGTLQRGDDAEEIAKVLCASRSAPRSAAGSRGTILLLTG